MLSQNEQQTLERIRSKFVEIRRYLSEDPQIHLDDPSAWFDFIAGFLHRLGNVSNDRSFIATLLASRYLQSRFAISSFDAAEKAQGANGLDIDLTTDDGMHVIAEIKCTVPYDLEKGDFGANQKHSIRNDFDKLNNTAADHKFFFLTDPGAYAVIQERYNAEIPGVEVVLLTDRTQNP